MTRRLALLSTGEEGPPPIVEDEGVSTGILDGGCSR
jgi:hypothetical protein